MRLNMMIHEVATERSSPLTIAIFTALSSTSNMSFSGTFTCAHAAQAYHQFRPLWLTRLPDLITSGSMDSDAYLVEMYSFSKVYHERPAAGARSQVSTDGRWRHYLHDLFYPIGSGNTTTFTAALL